jgi:hypothetical protein
MEYDLTPHQREWGDTGEVFAMYEHLDHVIELIDSVPESFPNRNRIQSHLDAVRRLLPSLKG